EAAYIELMMQLPNLASPEAPAGGEDDYVVLEHIGTPRDFAAEGFEPLDHVELGKRLGAFDIERGAKVSGARLYYLTVQGAMLESGTLPRHYAAFSPCYRKEAGSYGKDTRGIFRVHWFDKVELFIYTTLEESYAAHQRLLQWEKEWLVSLELPFRVIDIAAG